jgi:choice-of-anchor C domain-containing protein
MIWSKQGISRKGTICRSAFKILTLGFAVLASGAFDCAAEPIVLKNPTATFSQSGGWNVSLVTDGTTNNAAGWAIYDSSQGGAGPATAVFEADSDVGFASGSALTFVLYHVNLNPQHALGRFRLSYTTDARDTFANGLNSGGDVTANWTVLTPEAATATGGATLTILEDGSVLAGGENPVKSVYSVLAKTAAQGITGFRLEALEDSSLPSSGPGRFPNGNFVLTEITVGVVALTPTNPPPPTVLVVNGSFELGIEPGSQIDAPNSTAITGWDVVAGNIDYVGPSLWVAGDGARCLDLSGASAGTISQTISSLVEGQRYELLFLMAVNPDAPPPSTELLVNVGGISNRFSMSTAGNRSNLGWREQRLEFTALSTATVLQFTSLNPGWAGPVLDGVAINVSTNPPPPPPSGLVANGSFELGVDPGVGVQINSPDSNAITGWLVQNGNLDYIGTGWTAGDGNRSLDLSGTTAGTISQVISGLAPGQAYRLSFLMAGNPGLIPSLPAVKQLRASIGPDSHDYSFDATGFNFSNMGWTERALDFTANESSLTLSFTSLTDGLGGPALDKVAIQPVDGPPATNCPVPAGLVSWWRAEGNANDSVGNNHGQLRNGAGFAPGMVGQGFLLDGVNDYVLVPDSSTLDLTNEITVELWFKPDEWAAGDTLIDKRTFNDCNYGAIFSQEHGLTVYFADRAQGWHTSEYFPLPSVGVFHHFACTLAQADQDHVAVRTYLDGALVKDQLFLGRLANAANSAPVSIGTERDGAADFFKGIIDEISLYNRALSEAEVADIFHAGSAGKCIAPSAPQIFAGPQGQTVVRGGTVSFSVGASGTVPLSYQWLFNDVPIDGANASTLTLNDVQLSQSGSYSVTVSNALGTATSDHAVLVVNPPPATVRVVNANGAGAAEVSVPVELVANGNENALGFSLNFNANVLEFVGASLGLGAPSGAALLVNTNDAAAGRLGLVVGLPADEVFVEGTQQVALVTFLVAPILNQTTVPVSFGDQPTLRQLSDVHAQELPVVFFGGTVSIADSQFEGDVAPRPNGNRSVATVDWVQMGRFVARIDTISSPNEFQRADCTPRATKGNGLLTVSDWVQAGRYAVGLDPLTVLGGPTEPDAGGGAGGFVAASASGRQLSLVNTSISQGQTNVVPVTLECQGNENAASFSVVFDPAKLAFVSATPGTGSAGILLNLNSGEAAQGRLGVALAAQPGRVFEAGRREILQLRFAVLVSAPATAVVSFSNAPVPREVSDVAANPLPADYSAGIVSVTPSPGPPLRVTRSGNSLYITWPSSAAGFELEASESALGTAWSVVPGVILLGEQKLAIINANGHERYFRLRKP